MRFLKKIFDQYKKENIIFPIHPGMIKFLKKLNLKRYRNLRIMRPLNHQEILTLIAKAKLVVTDSGGLIREAFFMGVPLDVRLKGNGWEKEINIFGNGQAEARIKSIIKEICQGKLK